VWSSQDEPQAAILPWTSDCAAIQEALRAEKEFGSHVKLPRPLTNREAVQAFYGITRGEGICKVIGTGQFMFKVFRSQLHLAAELHLCDTEEAMEAAIGYLLGQDKRLVRVEVDTLYLKEMVPGRREFAVIPQAGVERR
jgi:hypothetical protein